MWGRPGWHLSWPKKIGKGDGECAGGYRSGGDCGIVIGDDGLKLVGVGVSGGVEDVGCAGGGV